MPATDPLRLRGPLTSRGDRPTGPNPSVVGEGKAPVLRPSVVELVGLSGVGKSSLARELARLVPGVCARPRVSLWRYAASVPSLLPIFAQLHLPFRRLLTKEMKRFLRLHALRRLVQTTRDCRVLVFDEGPLYLLARMLVYGGANVQTSAFEQLWRREVSQWATTLDAIVHLEAPEDVLAARRRARVVHPFGPKGEEGAQHTLRAYRNAYNRVLEAVAAAGGPAPVRVATDRDSVDGTARALLGTLRAVGGTSSRTGV